MPKKKRAQGLPVNIIILAILGLLVLIVLVFIFSRGSGGFLNIFHTCGGKGGDCKEKCESSEIEITGDDLCKEDDKPVCCKKIFGNEKTDEEP